jgi:hypothetical protein
LNKPGQLSRCLPIRFFPQVVRDDQPGHQRGQPEQHDHGKPESAERIAHLPDRVRGERESGRAERANQQLGQAQQGAPGAVGLDHPVNSRTRPVSREAT